MTTIPDNILETAITRLQNGDTIANITQDYPTHQDLAGLLEVTQLALHIPKLQAPTPERQYRFLESVQTAPYRFTEFFSFVRLAIVPLSLVIALIGGRIIVQATENSLPGDKLYAVKRATEKARLNLTLTDHAEATMHVELSQKRLAEVKKAFNSNNKSAETAAIAALQEQTEKTFAIVPQVAAVSAVTNKDSSLLNNLVSINKEQKSVLASIDVAKSGTEATETAIKTTKENDKTIAQLIATVNEQTLIDLPNKISITGIVSAYKGDKLTVEKNIFTVTPETEITNTEGASTEFLPEGTVNVTVIGSKTDKGIIAKNVTILSIEPTPIPPVAVTTPTPTVRSTTAAPTPKPSVQAPTPTPTTSAPSPTPTNQATGTYIVEPSEQQYTP